MSSDLAGVEGFTPGPWRRGQTGNMRIYGPDGRGDGITGLIADVKRPQDVDLIALAPTMYAELSRLRTALEKIRDCTYEGDPVRDIAREALRPALEGEKT